MPKLLTVCLTPEQQEQLEHIRDNDKRPYMRERASAILKIAEGASGRQVALDGLLKQRKPDTIYDWVERYQSEGISGLSIKPGRGRKPAFSPKYESKEEAKEAILHTVRREPSSFGKSRSRWSLSLIADVCAWLQVNTPSGMSQLLKRLGICYKRGRNYIHSPDPYYQQKMDVIAQCLLKAWYAPEKCVLLYQDEFTIYRQPTLDRDYEQMGKLQPLAHRSHGSNTEFRGIGALNAVTGQVIYHQASKADIRQLTVFYDMIIHNWILSTWFRITGLCISILICCFICSHSISSSPSMCQATGLMNHHPRLSGMLRSAKPGVVSGMRNYLSRFSSYPLMHPGQTLSRSYGDG